MKTVAISFISLLLMFSLPSIASAGPNKTVEVWIVEPSNAQTTVTAAQAVTASIIFLDEINAWFEREVGQVFDYKIATVPIDASGGTPDACGAKGSPFNAYYEIVAAGGGFAVNDRTMILMLGAGGWAGHWAPTDRDKGVIHMGMVGDWGVMEYFNLKVPCIPEWDFPNRGFSHEFAGMMGMYVGGGCYQDGQGCFVNDPLSIVEKTSLLKYSGRWLRNP